jgi:DNA-directed RNA polymerase subunit omega
MQPSLQLSRSWVRRCREVVTELYCDGYFECRLTTRFQSAVLVSLSITFDVSHNRTRNLHTQLARALFVENKENSMPLDNISELRKRVPGGKYALARAVAERARQLQSGATPLVEVRTPNPLSVAIDEIVQGKITFTIDTADQVEIREAEEKQNKADATASGAAA